MENIQWFELLQPFIAVKDLYLFVLLTLPIARALQELIGERATEVLPALRGIHVEAHHAVRNSAADPYCGHPRIMKIMLLPHSSFTIECVKLASRAFHVTASVFSLQFCRSHSPR
jgi:hypothetical protein